MSGALQAVYQNQREFATPLPAIGDAFGGGYFAGQISTAGNGVADYNLVVGPKSSADGASKEYKIVPTGGDPTSVIDGPTNSSTMNSATYPAAQFCEAVNVGGFTDWYMPAKNELEICYFNLKPSTGTNDTISGINPNAVPARASYYTNSPMVPDQTAVTNFQSFPVVGAESFLAQRYWSSTQNTNPALAYVQLFNSGNQNQGVYKDTPYRVRAVRRVAV